jgi:2-haloacid dehalogenase
VPDALVLDVGNVLIEWDPHRLYRSLIPEDDERARFLSEVCSPAWNDRQDRGRSLLEATRDLQARFPDHGEFIAAYYERWPEMLGDEIAGMSVIVDEVRASGRPVYGLTNFSAETFPIARERFPVLDRLDGVVVSGELGVAKPDREFFAVLCERYDVDPHQSVFVDDNPGHVEAARGIGFDALVFRDAVTLRGQLVERGFPLRSRA